MTDAIKPKLTLVSNRSAEPLSDVLDDDLTYSFTLLDCISPTATELSQADCSQLYALHEKFRELYGTLPPEIYIGEGGDLLVQRHPELFDLVRLVKKAGGTVSFHGRSVSASPAPGV